MGGNTGECRVPTLLEVHLHIGSIDREYQGGGNTGGVPGTYPPTGTPTHREY